MHRPLSRDQLHGTRRLARRLSHRYPDGVTDCGEAHKQPEKWNGMIRVVERCAGIWCPEGIAYDRDIPLRCWRNPPFHSSHLLRRGGLT
jgi:hypothetical protein